MRTLFRIIVFVAAFGLTGAAGAEEAADVAANARENAQTNAPVDTDAASSLDYCDDIPAFCRWEVRRLEVAYEIGLKQAKTPEDALEILRIRNAGLRMLVERTYMALLVWLSGRGDLIRALEDDQVLWSRGFEVMPTDTGRDLERMAAMLKNRLRVFGTIFGAITGEGFNPDENAGAFQPES